MEEQGRYWPILVLALSVWLAGGGWTFAQMDFEGSGFTLENFKFYGNCGAATRMDMLTDEGHPTLICGQEGAYSQLTAITILANQEGALEVRLQVGEQSHSDNRIAVALRIDKRPPISRTAYWDSANRVALIPDQDLPRSLLDELGTGERVVIRVGLAQGHIDLQGSAAAIADFRSRIRP